MASIRRASGAKKSVVAAGPRRAGAPAARRSQGWFDAIRLELEGCEKQFFQGDRGIILYAIQRSCGFGVPLPHLLLEELTNAIRRRTNYEAKTLDEALGLDQGRTKNTAKLRRWFAKDPNSGENLLYRVMSRIDELKGIDAVKGRRSKVTAIRKQVAKEFDLSERTILNMSQTAAELVKNFRKL